MRKKPFSLNFSELLHEYINNERIHIHTMLFYFFISVYALGLAAYSSEITNLLTVTY